MVEQTCAENCNDVKCKADKCGQACAGEGCSLDCSKGKCNTQSFQGFHVELADMMVKRSSI